MKFEEMKYEQIDIALYREKLTSATEKLKNAKKFDEAKSAFLEADKILAYINTMQTLTMIRHSINTKDAFYQEQSEFWSSASPILKEYEVKFKEEVLNSPFRAEFEKEFPPVYFKNLEISRRSFDKKIIPQIEEESRLVNEYENLMADVKIKFQNTEKTLSQFTTERLCKDNGRRRLAWQKEGEALANISEQLDKIFDGLVKIRDEMAKKLGFKDFTELGYLRMMRNCYGKKEVEEFRKNIVKYAVPLAEKIYKNQAKRMGTPYPLDCADISLMFKSGNPTPFGDEEYTVDVASDFYNALSKETGDFFKMMRENNLMSLSATENKAGGGFSTPIYSFKVPFIFANFNRTRDDVETVTHEAGHAFSAYLNRNRVPFETVWPSLDGCEIHSIGMEFLSWRFAEKFFMGDKDKFFYAHLTSAVTFLPYGAMVDNFQQIIYENPLLTPKERHGVWLNLSKTYMPWLKLDGKIPFYSEGNAWQRQLHIYHYPFYFIDYCIAWTVGLELWSIMQKDYSSAFKTYLNYTRGGGSLTLLELLASAKLNSPFDSDTLKSVMEECENFIDGFDFSSLD